MANTAAIVKLHEWLELGISVVPTSMTSIQDLDTPWRSGAAHQLLSEWKNRIELLFGHNKRQLPANRGYEYAAAIAVARKMVEKFKNLPSPYNAFDINDDDDNSGQGGFNDSADEVVDREEDSDDVEGLEPVIATELNPTILFVRPDEMDQLVALVKASLVYTEEAAHTACASTTERP